MFQQYVRVVFVSQGLNKLLWLWQTENFLNKIKGRGKREANELPLRQTFDSDGYK